LKGKKQQPRLACIIMQSQYFMGPVEQMFSKVGRTGTPGHSGVAAQLAVLGSSLIPILAVLYVGMRMVLREGSAYRRLAGTPVSEGSQRALKDLRRASAVGQRRSGLSSTVPSPPPQLPPPGDPVRGLLERVASRLWADVRSRRGALDVVLDTESLPTRARRGA
jgi:hypothetical protein